MIKNFNVKRGDQFSFTITFTNLTADLTTMNFGVKKDYDSALLISKSLKNGISLKEKVSFFICSRDNLLDV